MFIIVAIVPTDCCEVDLNWCRLLLIYVHNTLSFFFTATQKRKKNPLDKQNSELNRLQNWNN